MTAKADGSVKAGVWVIDHAGDSWHAINSGSAGKSTYEYQSSIKCDGTYQPGEPAIGWLKDPKTTPPANKFLPGPTGQMLDTWPCSYTGALGSIGKTQADGNSYVDMSRWNERYVADIYVTAYAKPATGAAAEAVARSWASDPWTFRTRRTGSPRRRVAVGICVKLRGTFRTNGSIQSQARAVRVRGDMVSLDIEGSDPSQTPKFKVALAPGWRVYANVPPLRAGRRISAPAALSNNQVVQLLRANTVLSANGRSSRFNCNLTFVREVGSKGGVFSCGVSIMAGEAGAGYGGRLPAPGWQKRQKRRSRPG